MALAVQQMAMESERLYSALAEEAREAPQEAPGGPSASRSNDELSLFVAQFGALDAALARALSLTPRDEALLLPDEARCEIPAQRPLLRMASPGV